MSKIEEIVKSRGPIEDLFRAVAKKYYCAADDGKVYVDKGYVRAIEAAQERVQELLGLSEEEKKKRAEAFNKVLEEEAKQYDDMSRDEMAVNNELVTEMIGRIDNVSTSGDAEFYDLKAEVYEELGALLKHPLPDSLQPLTVEKWYKSTLSAAYSMLQNQIATYENELNKVNAKNKLLEELSELLGEE